ncbi:phage protease [Morganella morganii]|uniref:Phage protease n=1 Tax=Morganella morganii TaxID=582 RepID=A0AAI9HQR5_MORMO|nr:phage protease [Providencia rettgeri]EKW8760497.1 phage protease [Morganella morganii]
MEKYIAACVAEILSQNLNEIQLFPAGEFRAVDGRPVECDAWLMTREIAETLIAQVAARQTPYVIDYEHQTLRASQNGKPAPAAGWFTDIAWREGDGLYAINVEWTEAAAAAITAKEYRFISPVFNYDKNGHVTVLLHAALTNTPAVDGMDEVMLAAASQFAALSQPTEEDLTVDDELIKELLSNLRWMLNLPATATAEDIKTELQKAIDLISNGQGTTVAANQSLVDLLKCKETLIADLSSKAYDPTKHVPLAGYLELQAKYNEALNAGQQQEVNGLIQAALSDGRLNTAMKDWAEELGRKDPDVLKGYLEKATPIAALTQLQSKGKAPAGAEQSTTVTTELTDDQLAICSQFGLDPEEFKKQLGE